MKSDNKKSRITIRNLDDPEKVEQILDKVGISFFWLGSSDDILVEEDQALDAYDTLQDSGYDVDFGSNIIEGLGSLYVD